jgi:hypothetical protein
VGCALRHALDMHLRVNMRRGNNGAWNILFCSVLFCLTCISKYGAGCTETGTERTSSIMELYSILEKKKFYIRFTTEFKGLMN